MTIRSNPHISFAVAFGFVATIGSWQLIEAHSPIWAITVGAGVMALILFFYPQGRTSLDVDHDAIRLTNGKHQERIELSALQGYWIDRLFSLRLVLLLTDGRRVFHPLEFVTCVAGVERALREAGVIRLDGAAREQPRIAEQDGHGDGE